MVRSRRWCCMEVTRDVAARLRLGSLRPSYTLEVFAARRSTQTPWGVPSVTGDAATNKSAPSRKHRDGRDTTSKRGRKGDSPSSGAAGGAIHDEAAQRKCLCVRRLAGGPGCGCHWGCSQAPHRALGFRSVNTEVGLVRQALHPCAGFGSTAGNTCSRE